jgi:hypothetical protein
VIIPIGTLINVGTVLVGTLIGMMIGDRLPERMRELAMQAIGLITLTLGLRMAGATHNVLITLGSAVAGAVLGEWWHIDERLEAMGHRLEYHFGRSNNLPGHLVQHAPAPSGKGRVAQGFIGASLLFCVGPMTILGSVNDGIAGDYQLLAIKSLMDGIASIALASALGWGVALSILTLLVVQGGISVAAALLGQQTAGLIADKVVRSGSSWLPLGTALLDEMTAVGGVTLLALALVLLDLKQVRAANLLPGLVLGPLIVLVLYAIGVPLAP